MLLLLGSAELCKTDWGIGGTVALFRVTSSTITRTARLAGPGSTRRVCCRARVVPVHETHFSGFLLNPAGMRRVLAHSLSVIHARRSRVL